jgi:hypothetical protein
MKLWITPMQKLWNTSTGKIWNLFMEKLWNIDGKDVEFNDGDLKHIDG